MQKRLLVATLLFVFLGTSVVAYADEFGAIAYSKRTQRYGWATGKRSRTRAENAALEQCDRNDCKIEVWFRDTCAALATGSDGQVTGWAYNDSLREAKERAVRECRERDGERCHVVIAKCSGAD